MDKMTIEPLVAAVIKVACCFAVAFSMLLYAPKVLRPVPFAYEMQQTIPERMASTEQRLSAVEHRMDTIESAKLGEQMVAIQDRIQGLLIISVPMALFVFIHTLQVILGLRERFGLVRKPYKED